jgi:hypothetical protein
MSGTSEQITILYRQGNSPEQISELLSLELTDVLLILNDSGLLSKRNVKTNLKVNAIMTSEGGPSNINTNDVALVSNENAEDIFKKYQSQVARKIINIALSEPDETLPASVVAKCAIYAREEGTGRNEARAKKDAETNRLVKNIGELFLHAQMAANSVNRALGVKEKDIVCISVESEKVA